MDVLQQYRDKLSTLESLCSEASFETTRICEELAETIRHPQACSEPNQPDISKAALNLSLFEDTRDKINELREFIADPSFTSLEACDFAHPISFAARVVPLLIKKNVWVKTEADRFLPLTLPLLSKIDRQVRALESDYQTGTQIPGTQFTLGKINTPDQILSLRNWPEYKARLELMRPGNLAVSGFLGDDEDLAEVLIADQAELAANGLDQLTAGKWLNRLIKSANGFRNWFRHVRCVFLSSSMGFQTPPLPGAIRSSKMEGHLFRGKQQSDGIITEMHGDLLRQWGFCQGKNTSFAKYSPEQRAVFEQEFCEHFGDEFSAFLDKESEPTTYRVGPAELAHFYFNRR